MKPDIVAFVPIKNCSNWLTRFIQQLDKMQLLNRIVFSYGDSRDSTLNIVENWMEHTKKKVQIIHEPLLGGALSSAEIGRIYLDFQAIMAEGDETHAALIDADLMGIPPTTLPKLLKHDVDIIAPYVWTMFHHPPQFYDTFVFRKDGLRFHPWKPPMNEKKLLELDSVGTFILTKREPFLEVPYGDPYPHKKFCDDAREAGYKVFADPSVEVRHIDLTRFGIFHEQLAIMKARRRGDAEPGRYVDRTPFIKDDGTIVDLETLNYESVFVYVWGSPP